jgi:phage shock protein PspC (stress-responsive transcriptional regulator)
MADYRAPLRRSRSDRMVAGVVAGLARYAGIDVTLARVLYVLVSMISAAFPGLIAYVVLWVVMPEGD